MPGVCPLFWDKLEKLWFTVEVFVTERQNASLYFDNISYIYFLWTNNLGTILLNFNWHKFMELMCECKCVCVLFPVWTWCEADIMASARKENWKEKCFCCFLGSKSSLSMVIWFGTQKWKKMAGVDEDSVLNAHSFLKWNERTL